MKDSLLKGLWVILAVVLLSSAPASAGSFAVYGTWWDTDDAGDAGGIGLNYAWRLGEVVDLETRLAWYEELTDKPLDDFFSGDSPLATGLTVIPLEVGIRFNFARDSNVWSPWAGGGVAYYALDTDSGNVDDEIGFYATLGSMFGDGKGADFYAEVGYRFVEGQVSDLGDLDDDGLDDAFDVSLNGPFASAGVAWRW